MPDQKVPGSFWGGGPKSAWHLLVIFWLIGWLAPVWSRWKPELKPRSDTIVVGPLTAPEKFLLGYKLKVNELSEKEWEALPNVGPQTAKKIIEYQIKHGPYSDLDSLMDVKGIGPRTVEVLRQFFDTPNP